MKNISNNPYTYLTLENSDVSNFQSQIFDLLALYYKNPEEVFEMIYPKRIFFVAFHRNKLIGLYSVKHTNSNANTILAYLGLLIIHPHHGKILINLVTAHIEVLKTYIDHKIYIYSLTSNPQVQKIASKFYHNVYPRNLKEKEIEIPEFYGNILSFTDYRVCQHNPYKVIDSPSVAKYTKAFINNLLQATANLKDDFYQLYDLDVESRDRLLIIGTNLN